MKKIQEHQAPENDFKRKRMTIQVIDTCKPELVSRTSPLDKSLYVDLDIIFCQKLLLNNSCGAPNLLPA